MYLSPFEFLIQIGLVILAIRWWKPRRTHHRRWETNRLSFVIAGIVMCVLAIVGLSAGSTGLSPVAHGHGAIFHSQGMMMNSHLTWIGIAVVVATATSLTWLFVKGLKHRPGTTLLVLGGLGAVSMVSFGAFLFGPAVPTENVVAGSSDEWSEQAFAASPDTIAQPPSADEIVTEPSETSITIPNSIVEVIHTSARGDFAERSLSELPDWVQEAPSRRQSGTTMDLMLRSERFATLQEARHQLWERLNRDVQRYLTDEYPEIQAWTPTREQAEDAGILQRECLVTYPLQVGGFTENVYQVFWDVQLNEATGERLYSAWRPEEIQKRLLFLGSAFGLMTVFLGVGAFAMRHHNRPATVDA